MYDFVKRFKNGNLNVKFDVETIEGIISGEYDFIECFSEILWEKDTYLYGEEFCLSNYDMGINLYNCNQNKVYTLSFSSMRDILLSGKTLKLYARTPNADDMEILESEGFAFC